ncbi:AAA family ATPase [bacterium]|nr:AAA family ATPase [bacterium]
MRIARLKVNGFRGIQETMVFLTGHCVLVGDNNVGKSTILEAIDLLLGPERLRRTPPIDEHDFYAGEYLSIENVEDDDESDEILPSNQSKIISIEAIIVNLNADQTARFSNHIEWWDTTNKLIVDGPVEAVEQESIISALRVEFEGMYDPEEDDFIGKTYFSHPIADNGTKSSFKTTDKRFCGFLFLRTLRTGSRALSLERGSLLDIILRLREEEKDENRVHMWEDILNNLRSLEIATDTEKGLSEILESVQNSLRKYVPTEWADKPRLRVSELTRESLRRIITVYLDTGIWSKGDEMHSVPFRHQGTGTINLLVLALLAMIAELKQNVIFAMEEPEIAIPPYTQKQIILSIRKIASQSIFTSHSPYVLEEFDPNEILVLNRDKVGKLTTKGADLPPAVKAKAFRQTLRQSMCEGLLARRIVLVEGRTEYDAWPMLARHLSDQNQDRFQSFEALGLAVINANTDSQIAPLGQYYLDLGKEVYALYDKQENGHKADIEAVPMNHYESPEKGFENVLLSSIKEQRLRDFAEELVREKQWPTDMNAQKPTSVTTIGDLKKSMLKILSRSKGDGLLGQLFLELSIDEMPTYITNTLEAITSAIIPLDEETVKQDEDSTEEINPIQDEIE